MPQLHLTSGDWTLWAAPGLLKKVWMEVAQSVLEFFDFREPNKVLGVVFFFQHFIESVNFLRNSPYAFHKTLQSYSTLTRRVPRVWKDIKIVWMGCEQRSQNEHKIGQKTDLFRLFSTSSKTLPYDFLTTFLFKFQISQIHCQTPLRWTVSQKGSHFLWFLGYIPWYSLQTFVEKNLIGSSTAIFGLFLI